MAKSVQTETVGASLRTRGQSLHPTRWQERTDSPEFSSDLQTCTLTTGTCTNTGVHAQTYTHTTIKI